MTEEFDPAWSSQTSGLGGEGAAYVKSDAEALEKPIGLDVGPLEQRDRPARRVADGCLGDTSVASAATTLVSLSSRQAPLDKIGPAPEGVPRTTASCGNPSSSQSAVSWIPSAAAGAIVLIVA